MYIVVVYGTTEYRKNQDFHNIDLHYDHIESDVLINSH